MQKGMMWGLLLLLLLAPISGQSEPFFFLIGLQQARMLGEMSQMHASNSWGTIRQTNEVTCGPAALATLLSFYLGEPATEKEIAGLSGTFKEGTTTLLGLRDAARAKGHEAIGYQMTLPQLLEQLDRSTIPVLVHFQQPELHYVLVTGHIGTDYLLVSDPAMGDVVLQQADFLRRWSNKALVVQSERTPSLAVMVAHKQSVAARIATLEKAGDALARMR